MRGEFSTLRTEFCQLPVIPFLAHHPVQTNRQFSRHCDLSDFPSSPPRQVVILTPPFRQAPRRHFPRLHPHETQRRAPLFHCISQPPLIPPPFLYPSHTSL